MAFQDYSLTPADNTTLADGTYVGPNMLRNKVRPAIQQIMADGKEMYGELLGYVADPSGGPFYAAGTGAVGRTYQAKNRDSISVKDFGAVGDSDTTGATGTDDTAAIQAALTHISTLGGGSLFFPEGFYKITAYLTVSPKTRIVGAGGRASTIVCAHAGGGGANAHENLRNGSVFVSLSAIDSSTAVNVSVRDIGIKNTNVANVGSGFYDRGGTFVDLTNVYVEGFKFGAVLDQSELSDINLCEFKLQNAGGAGVWLVNGADLTAGADILFTNRISIKHCQFNQDVGSYGILDDGGYSHSFVDNNYNGCLNHIRAAGVDGGLVIQGGEFEGAASHCISLQSTTLAGGGVGSCSGRISGCLISAVAGFGAVNIVGANKLEIGGGSNFSVPTGFAIRGCSNANQLDIGTLYLPFGSLADGVGTRHREIQTTGAELLQATGTWDGNTGANPTHELRQAGGIVRSASAGTYWDFQANMELAFNRYGNQVSLCGRNFIVSPTVANLVSGAYQLAGVQVVGARSTGWTADTGTAEKTAHATYAGGTANATYLQAEITAIRSALQDVSRGQKAIKDALIAHGLIGT